MTPSSVHSIANPLGAVCRVCGHDEKSTIDALLAEGANVAQLVQQFGLSRDSLYRHLRWHLRPALAAELRRDSEVRPAALVERIAAIANDAREARRAAYNAGNAWLGARLGEAELRALTALAERFGIEHDDDANELAEAASIARVLGNVTRYAPEVGELIAQHFDADNRHDLGDMLRDQAARARVLDEFSETAGEAIPA